MESKSPKGACVFRDNFVMVTRIGIGDAAAARRHAFESAFVKRLKKNKKRAWLGHLLRINELFAAAKLSGGNVVLHTGHHHRDDCKWFGYASDFSGHSDFHDLSLDLPETGL